MTRVLVSPQTPAKFPAATQRPTDGTTGCILPHHRGRVAHDKLHDKTTETCSDSCNSGGTNGARRKAKDSSIELCRDKHRMMLNSGGFE